MVFVDYATKVGPILISEAKNVVPIDPSLKKNLLKEFPRADPIADSRFSSGTDHKL